MEAIRIQKVVEKDGEIFMRGLPFKKGQHIEMILLIEPSSQMPALTLHPSPVMRSSGCCLENRLHL